MCACGAACDTCWRLVTTPSPELPTPSLVQWFTGHHAFSLRQLFTTALAGGYGLGAAAANARGAQQTVQQRQQRWDKVS